MIGPFLPVKTKADFVRRYLAGEFGNRAPSWETVEDYLRDDYVGPVHLRNRVAGGPTFYDVPNQGAIRQVHTQALMAGAEPGSFYVSAMAPTEKTAIQGEVMQSEPDGERSGLELYYTRVKKPMREALREEADRVWGVTSSGLLRAYMDVNSYEWLQTLIDRYPGHVIEFSTYWTKWGSLFPHYNTVFWEVRLY